MPADVFTIRAPRERNGFDWRSIRDQVAMTTLAEALLGHPHKTEGGRSLWRCPFHEERTPSFTVEPRRSTWKCWGCGEHGDGADLVGRLEHLEFPASARRAAEIVGLMLPESGTYQPPKPRPTPPPEPPKPSGLDPADALRIVRESEACLWTAAGKVGLDYLRGRGLTDETIRKARLGWSPGFQARAKDGHAYRAAGVVTPWFDGDRLAMVKVRQLGNAKVKYLETFRDLPRAFPSLAKVRAGFPLVVVEGEFDALLLDQEIGGSAAVVTVGSASNALTPDLFRALLPASPWYVATDGDQAGDKFAAGWPASARRVRPLGGEKDWTDLHATGFNRIRYQWFGILPLSPLDQESHPISDPQGDLPEFLSATGNPNNPGNPTYADACGLNPEWLRAFNRGIGRPDA